MRWSHETNISLIGVRDTISSHRDEFYACEVHLHVRERGVTLYPLHKYFFFHAIGKTVMLSCFLCLNFSLYNFLLPLPLPQLFFLTYLIYCVSLVQELVIMLVCPFWFSNEIVYSFYLFECIWCCCAEAKLYTTVGTCQLLIHLL